MSATVWSKFYWSDWLSDAGLRRSSFAAKGLWIDMLCIAAQSDPIGYLTVKKVPLSVNDIARMCGGSEPEVGTMIAELERNGVLSRDRNGTIYCRRMLRDARKYAEAKSNGSTGGNPKLTHGYNKPGFIYLIGVRSDGAYKIGISNNPANRLKKIKRQYPGQDLQVLDTAPVVDMGATEADVHSQFLTKKSGEWFLLNRLDVGNVREIFSTLKGPVNSQVKAQKPETTIQKESKNTCDEKFEEAWQAYPRRDGGNPKAPAAKRFLAYVKSGFDPQEIIEGVKRFAAAEARNVGTPYIPQMVKWLGDQRWLDYGPGQSATVLNIRGSII